MILEQGEAFVYLFGLYLKAQVPRVIFVVDIARVVIEVKVFVSFDPLLAARRTICVLSVTRVAIFLTEVGKANSRLINFTIGLVVDVGIDKTVWNRIDISDWLCDSVVLRIVGGTVFFNHY